MLRDRLIDYAGAWAFFLLSLGIFMLPFSSLMCNHYAGDGSKGWTLSLALLCFCLCLITVGTGLLVAWCLKGGPTKPSKGEDLPLNYVYRVPECWANETITRTDDVVRSEKELRSGHLQRSTNSRPYVNLHFDDRVEATSAPDCIMK